MDRYTRKDAEQAFRRLVFVTGHRVAHSWNDVGGWALDYNSVYGGFNIEEISNPGGGVSLPFGEGRRTAREFCDAVRFAIHAIDTMKEGNNVR